MTIRRSTDEAHCPVCGAPYVKACEKVMQAHTRLASVVESIMFAAPEMRDHWDSQLAEAFRELQDAKK